MRNVDFVLLSMRMAKGHSLKNPIAFVCVVVSLCCLLVVIISLAKLPEISGEDNLTSNRLKTTEKVLVDENVGLFGKMIIEMLPEDLAFTVFVPSRRAFEHDLKLNENDSLAASVPLGEEIRYDSLSGFSLYTSKDPDGMLIVNGVRAEHVDLRKGKIAVHIMDGVIMDAEFERSFQPDDSEED
ncbi:uncharacterized protein LOC127796274 isoform X2 [Diospyros lotus]|uniref:uncharacterized protein LOC127796274 isoform X2 n=1 Tax=Diospyros lotus TaxID=55363 RepID=UPI00225246C4|nr:uncharacterized protein LOC127796274 isoform X2 [Diospyros lotus]